MVFLVAKQDMIEEWAVRRQEGACNFQRLRMPILRLVRLLSDVKVFEALQLVLELNDKSDLGRDAKVAHDQKADRLQEGESVKLLLVSSERYEVF
jgi:hypothetical protein